MQYCKIDSRLIDFVFDKSKLKQNRFTPGTNIKIFDPKHISKKVDYLLVLSWNIIKEIMIQENSFIKKVENLLFHSQNQKYFLINESSYTCRWLRYSFIRIHR